MPILDPSVYPEYWDQVSEWIRFIRAKGQCECRGHCGTPHGYPDTHTRCPEKQWWVTDQIESDFLIQEIMMWNRSDPGKGWKTVGGFIKETPGMGIPHPEDIPWPGGIHVDGRVILTVAHLNHDPTTCDALPVENSINLAMCQTCHNKMDMDVRTSVALNSDVQQSLFGSD